jgi:hypothetical protein
MSIYLYRINRTKVYKVREHAYDLLILSMSMSMYLYRSNRTKVCEVGEHACDVYSYGKHDAKKRWEALRDPLILCDYGGDMGLSFEAPPPVIAGQMTKF